MTNRENNLIECFKISIICGLNEINSLKTKAGRQKMNNKLRGNLRASQIHTSFTLNRNTGNVKRKREIIG